MQTFLITGATGYIGRNLAVKLLAQGHIVHILVRPSSDLSFFKDKQLAIIIHRHDGSLFQLKKIFAAIRADIVIHTAAISMHQHSSETLLQMLEANIQFGSNVLEAMANTGHGCFINTGTYWQTPNDQNYNPVALYAAHKQAFEAILTYYIAAKNFKAVTLRLFDVYGPADPRPKILNLFNKAIKTNTALAMSPGEQLMELIYIDDVVAAYLKTADYLLQSSDHKHDIFYVGTGRAISLKEIANIFAEIAGKPIPIIWGAKPYRDREVMQPWLGKTVPGWQASYTLEAGIRSLLNAS